MLRRLVFSSLFTLLAVPVFAQSGVDMSGMPTLPISQPIAGRLIVVYRRPVVPANADVLARIAGARTLRHFAHLGMTALSVGPADEARALATLSANPQVALVVHDRYVTASTLLLNRLPVATALDAGDGTNSRLDTSVPVTRQSVMRAPIKPRSAGGSPIGTAPNSSTGTETGGTQPSSTSTATAAAPTYDTLYNSPAGWAVRAAGGYGANVSGGSASGPWSRTLGAGVRIAILDSGVDANHPDIAPNLALNLSEINQAVLASPCDDGSPQDQSGHGTWTASLAAGALGPDTGNVIGVAPQATILNIKVLQRMPASGMSDTAAACEAGQPGGLLSWVLQGIDDAVANHADVIALSLGTLVDISTGEGAGLKAAFDQATWAATQAGSVVIAALGNDDMDLSTGTLVELPAQSRGVLAITASTNPDCAENLTAGATCSPGPVTRPYYSNHYAALNAIAAPGGSYPEGPTEANNAAASSGSSGWIMGACSSGLINTADGLPGAGDSLGCFNLGHAGYVQAMGTSASAALAAGAAAILRGSRPDLTAAEIVSILRSSATVIPTLAEPQLNLAAALAQP
ncbi:MAG TPA: S8 family serine peptidase [Acidobacteriaceae bacterium]